MLNGVLNEIYRPEIINPKIDLVYLDLTNNCNLRCEMCFLKQEKKGYMSKTLFESCVDQLSQMGVGTLYLYHGGESLLHPDFKDYLKYAVYHRDHGWIQQVAWVDNGMLFNQSISDLVVDLKVDVINFSIDGVGEVNDKIRLGSKYSVVERNLKYLINRRGDSVKPKVILSMVDYGKTEDQKMDVYRNWVPFVDQIDLIPYIRHDKTCSACGTGRIAKPPAFCRVPFQMMVISWDGKVTGCCIDYT
jgi:sulfatase maturation enzyme AslB (radical SAM superfamily)